MRIKLTGTKEQKANSFYVLLRNFSFDTIKKNHFTLFNVPEYDLEVRKFLKEKGVKYKEELK